MIRKRTKNQLTSTPIADAEDPRELDRAASEHATEMVADVTHLAPARSAHRRWTQVSTKRWTLLAVCLGTFMLLLDITVVNVALPDIQRELDASFTDLQWVVDAYSLMLASVLLTAGSLADLFGRRRVFAIGLVLFSLASLLCGLAGHADGAQPRPRLPGGRRRGDVRLRSPR